MEERRIVVLFRIVPWYWAKSPLALQETLVVEYIISEIQIQLSWMR